MDRSDLRTEKLPDDAKSDYLNILLQEVTLSLLLKLYKSNKKIPT